MDTVVTVGRQQLPSHQREPGLHAGFWLRWVACIIDVVILGFAYLVLCFAVTIPLVILQPPNPGSHLDPAWSATVSLLIGIFCVVIWLYFALLESSKWQATPGKRALGLRVTDLYGCRIGFGKATGRLFGMFLSYLILNIGFLMAGLTARKQALHDMLAGCCVVRKEGLVAFECGEFDASAVPRTQSGVPGWAIALIVFGAVFSLMIIAAIIIPAYKH